VAPARSLLASASGSGNGSARAKARRSPAVINPVASPADRTKSREDQSFEDRMTADSLAGDLEMRGDGVEAAQT
jgi:hypothetical protein